MMLEVIEKSSQPTSCPCFTINHLLNEDGPSLELNDILVGNGYHICCFDLSLPIDFWLGIGPISHGRGPLHEMDSANSKWQDASSLATA